MWPCTAAHESLLDHTLPHPTLPQSSWHLQNTPHLLPPQTLCTHSASARTFFPTCLQGSPLHFCRLALMSPSERQGQKGYCLGDSLPPLPNSVSFPCTGQPPVYQACICFCVHSLSSTVPGVCLAHNRWKEWMLNEWTPREKTAHFTSQTRRIKHGLETEFVIYPRSGASGYWRTRLLSLPMGESGGSQALLFRRRHLCIFKAKIASEKVKQATNILFKAITIGERGQNSVWTQLHWGRGGRVFKCWGDLVGKYWSTLERSQSHLCLLIGFILR